MLSITYIIYIMQPLLLLYIHHDHDINTIIYQVWWDSLSMIMRRVQKNKEYLIVTAEQIIMGQIIIMTNKSTGGNEEEEEEDSK